MEPQITIRNLTDVEGGGGGGPTGDIVEGFNAVLDATDVALAGWSNVATEGTRFWRGKVFSGNHYVQATAYNSTDAANEIWLVTPGVTVDAPKKLSFQSGIAFWNHDGLTVYYSTNYDGSNVAAATWTPLTCTLAGQADANYAWVSSGDVNLPPASGTVHVAFKYVGNATAGQTTSCLIDNVVIGNQ
jgi:hypothetical protein